MKPQPIDTGANAADLRHVRNWIFDLDNTLYRADSGIFARIDARMSEYIADFLGVDRPRAREIQKALYKEHGTTLNGLIKSYGADPEAYLAYVHRIDLSGLAPDAALAAALARLPGRRYVFTNGCAHHAGRVLARLGLSNLIDAIWDIRSIGFAPKPDARAYDSIVALGGFAPAQAAMFDDIARNLVPAHALGITTIWLDGGAAWARQGPDFPVASPCHIDHETRDLTQFLNSVRI